MSIHNLVRFPGAEPVQLSSVSRSSLVLALLRTLGTADPALPAEFTADDVERVLALPHHDGAVTGFLSRAAQSGMLRELGVRRGGRYLYALADVALAPRVRATPSHGSNPGKRLRGTAKPSLPNESEPLAAVAAPPAPKVPSDRERLLELAAELTEVALRLATGRTLDDASTEELLCELGRRAGCAVRSVAE